MSDRTGYQRFDGLGFQTLHSSGALVGGGR
jgi:hypothetical protein